MTDEIYETPSTTPNFQTELAAQLADLIPEAIADGKVDVEKLKELLDGDVTEEPMVPVRGQIAVRRARPSQALLARWDAAPARQQWWRDRLARCHAVLAGRSGP